MNKRLFVAIILMAVVAFFYSKYVRNVPVVIPFEVIRNSIIFDMEIEGETYNFFFDTGAGTIVSPELKDKHGLDSIGNYQMMDFYGNTATITTSTLPELRLNQLSKKNLEVAILRPLQNFQFCDIKIDGILGLEYFDGKVIKLNLRKGELTVATAITFLEEDFGSPLPLTYKHGLKRTHLDIHYSDSTFSENVLFDTGALNDLLRLSNTSLQKLLKDSILNTNNILDTIYINESKGLIGAQNDSINYRVHIPKLKISEYEFLNPVVNTFDSWNESSILGAGILAKGVIVLDLLNDDFYFKPYPDAILDYRSPLDFLTSNGRVLHVKDSSNAYKAGVKKGHLLRVANGIKLDSMSLCEQQTMDWIEFYNQKNIKFTFESEDGQIIYNYTAQEPEND
ncbi:retropepsin-like aspartic protease [Algoriphagus yeomjeoni]|uniref:Aspartyl protease n=1 Tax=Algoriphagus yeomjeoni TaxID=291403 RepID=A0A327PRC0_9BACT|nr:retropepsin-like aspartic protease [Algoriphagus yeomjeoni]RAI94107.1 aspartyl protease [Algoriphagus yeomjeoni]